MAVLGSAPILDWRAPLPCLVKALVGLVPDGPCSEEAATKLHKAFAVASAELSARHRRHLRPFEQLPHILLEHTLGFAWSGGTAEMRCVNARWRRAVSKLGLLRRIRAEVLLKRTMNATQFVALLKSRPEFSKLGVLQLPPSVRLGVRGAELIVRLCPDLQVLDLGYMCPGTSISVDAFHAVLEGLPQLVGIRLALRVSMDATEPVQISQQLGLRLRELRVEGGFSAMGTYVCDGCLQALANRCPHLRCFALHYDGLKYDWREDGLTSVGLQALILSCGQLEELELGLATRIGLPAFELLVSRLEAGKSCLRFLRTFGVISLESADGQRMQKRLSGLLRGFSSSEGEYRALLRTWSRSRPSIFLPAIEYLLGQGIIMG